MTESMSASATDRNDARAEARRWVHRKRIFYTIVGIYLVLSLMWFAIDVLGDPSTYWFYWPVLGMGLGVIVTWIVMFALFGADWERRQVEKYVERRSDETSRPSL